MIERIATPVALLICIVLVSACMQLPTREGAGGEAAARTEETQQAKIAAALPEYRLGPGDVVKVTVYNNPDLTTEAEISQSGNLSFPLIGEVPLGGLSRAEAEKAIAERLGTGGFVPNAYVNVLVTQYQSQQVAVIGEVNKPGKYQINRTVTVTDLIAMAGGITPKGSNMVTIIKKDKNGKAAQYQINVKNVLASGDLSKNVRVDPEDIIYVPPAPVFYIYGEVRQPGAYPLASDMTVRQALSLGGGLTLRGSERGIQVERKGPDGQIKTYSAALTDKLQADDVVQVPEGWF